MSVQFQYDHNGLRTRKTVTENGVTTVTDYSLHGKLITHLTRGTNNLHFFYDAQSRPAKVEFNGTMYTYLHNLQGDVVGIVDNNGVLVVEYKYDAWGKPTSTWTLTAEYQALAVCNPFRYRGYVYDGETGLYYLRSRYYNSETSRWINVDSLLNQESILGNNIFVYCLNDPIDMADETGNLPFLAVTAAIGAVVGAVVGGVVAAKSGGNVWAGIGIGAAAGALIGTGAGASAGAALAGSITATTAAVMAGGGALVGTVATGGLGAGALRI